MLTYNSSKVFFTNRNHWRILLALLCTGLQGCIDPHTTEIITPAEPGYTWMHLLKDSLKNGDLLLRTGTDFSSEQVKGFSKTEQVYSHGGIAVWDEGNWKVYHVEPDYYHQRDRVRKEPLDSFLNPSHNLGFALARYELQPTEITKLISYLETQYSRKVPFDMNFDLQTDDALYCSEMIQKGLSQATRGRISIQTQPLEDRSKYKLIQRYFKLPVKSFAHRLIIPIDQLYLNQHCRVLFRETF